MGELVETVRHILLGLEHHQILAAVLYFFIHIVFAALFLPCSPLTAMAGLLWGFWGGLAISIGSALTASSVTFMLGRYLKTRWPVSKLQAMSIGRLPARVLAMIERAGWRAVFVLQLNPIVPASSFGYIFGSTRLGFRLFFVSTALGILFSQCMLVGLGSFARNAVFLDDPTKYAVYGLILLISFGLISYWGRRIAKDPMIGIPTTTGPHGDA
jgi:uncharacterized membrane protein YdjX (TVP38/TMEM64 family)